jgi:hypothetical protein
MRLSSAHHGAQHSDASDPELDHLWTVKHHVPETEREGAVESHRGEHTIAAASQQPQAPRSNWVPFRFVSGPNPQDPVSKKPSKAPEAGVDQIAACRSEGFHTASTPRRPTTRLG